MDLRKEFLMKRLVIYLVTFYLLVYLSTRLFIFENVNDPIKYIYTITGGTATVIFIFSIIISLIKEKINLMKYQKKEVGLIGFFYSFLHLFKFCYF